MGNYAVANRVQSVPSRYRRLQLAKSGSAQTRDSKNFQIVKGASMIKTDANGDIYIPLPHEAKESIMVGLLLDGYRTLMHSHKHTTEKLYKEPGRTVHQEDYEHQAKYKEAFETLIDYYGG